MSIGKISNVSVANIQNDVIMKDINHSLIRRTVEVKIKFIEME
jgi:hypothetical protein